MAAGVEQLEHRARRSKAGRERVALAAAFEIGDAAFVGHARGILRARVFVALVHARTRLHVGRGRVDRRHDCAGRGIGMLAGVDGAGAEGQFGGLAHGIRIIDMSLSNAWANE